jgi:hypothetical protein
MQHSAPRYLALVSLLWTGIPSLVLAQSTSVYKMPLPTEVMNGSILFASLIGPPDGYVVSVRLNAEFVAGGSFTADDLQVVISAPTQPNFDHWVVQGSADLGWPASGGLHAGSAQTLALNGEVQTSLPGASIWNLVIEPVQGSGHNGVTGQFTANAWFELELLPAGAGPGVGYCFGSACPCGNDDVGAGCANSSGAGALLEATGLASVALDDLALVAAGLPAGNLGLAFAGQSQWLLPFGAGLNCVAPGPLGLLRLPAGFADPAGSLVQSNVISLAQGTVPGSLAAGSTWNFQVWYRDPAAACGNGVNLSNALRVVIIP